MQSDYKQICLIRIINSETALDFFNIFMTSKNNYKVHLLPWISLFKPKPRFDRFLWPFVEKVSGFVTRVIIYVINFVVTRLDVRFQAAKDYHMVHGFFFYFFFSFEP